MTAFGISDIYGHFTKGIMNFWLNYYEISFCFNFDYGDPYTSLMIIGHDSSRGLCTIKTWHDNYLSRKVTQIKNMTS